MYINSYCIRSIRAFQNHFDFGQIWELMENPVNFVAHFQQLLHDEPTMDDAARKQVELLCKLTNDPARAMSNFVDWDKHHHTCQLKPTLWRAEDGNPPNYIANRVIPPEMMLVYNKFVSGNMFTQNSACELLRFLYVHALAAAPVTPQAWAIFEQRFRWLYSDNYAVDASQTDNGEIRLPRLKGDRPTEGGSSTLTVVRFTVSRYGEIIRFRLGDTSVCRTIRRGAALYAVRRDDLGYTGFLDVRDAKDKNPEWDFGMVRLSHGKCEIPAEDCLTPLPPSGDGSLFIGWNSKLYTTTDGSPKEVAGSAQVAILDACGQNGRYAWIGDDGSLFDGEHHHEKVNASAVALHGKHCLWIADDKCYCDGKLLRDGEAVTAFARVSGRFAAIDYCGGTKEWNMNI